MIGTSCEKASGAYTFLVHPRESDGKTGVGPLITTLDGGGLGCVRLLMALRDAATRVRSGTIIHLSTTDPVAGIDLAAWCSLTGHVFLGLVDPSRPGVYAIQTTAAPLATQTTRPWHVEERPGA